MKVLVTAGSTQVPIDKVRFVSNGFKGKTGRDIARYFTQQGAEVTLLTSGETRFDANLPKLQFVYFQTFDELATLMENYIRNGNFDVVIHSAAVSDYAVSQVLDENLQPVSANRKISSAHQKLYLEMKPTIKLVDQIREPWGFGGKLVKFKLQVGISDEALLDIAEQSRIASKADIVVANCLEWAKERAYVLGPKTSVPFTVSVIRLDLPKFLYWRLKECPKSC